MTLTRDSSLVRNVAQALVLLQLSLTPTIALASSDHIEQPLSQTEKPPIGDFDPRPSAQVRVVDDGPVIHDHRLAIPKSPQQKTDADNAAPHTMPAATTDAVSSTKPVIDKHQRAQGKFIISNHADFLNEIKRATKITGTKEDLIEHLVKAYPANYQPSPTLIGQVHNGLSYFPRDILVILVAHKVNILVADKATDLKPGLAMRKDDKKPRNYHQIASGMFYTRKNSVVVGATTPRDGIYLPTDDIQRVVRHEVGHALDRILPCPSWTFVFARAHSADKQRLSAAAKRSNAYYLQNGLRGLEETFAELVSAHYSKPDSPALSSIERSFPNCYAIVNGILSRPETTVSEFMKLTAERDKLEAIRKFDDALEIQDKITTLCASGAPLDFQTPGVLDHTAILQAMAGSMQAAEAAYKKCIDAAAKQAPYEDRRLIAAQTDLAWQDLHFGRWKEAFALCEEAEKIVKKDKYEKTWYDLQLQLTLSSALRQKGDYDDAYTAAQKALLFAQEDGKDASDVNLAKLRLAQVQYFRGDTAAGEEEFRTVASLCENAKERYMLSYIKTRLAEIELKKGNLQIAKKLSAEALALNTNDYKDKSPYVVDDLVVSAQISTAQKQFDEAEKTLQKAIALSEKTGYAYDINRINAWQAYAKLLNLTGRSAKAAEMDAQASSMKKAYESID